MFRNLAYGAALLLISAGTWISFFDVAPNPSSNHPTASFVSAMPESPSSATVVFVGDIMPARYVETLAKRHGWDFLFASSSAMFSGADVVFGNFEAAIPAEHVSTRAYSLVLSAPKDALPALRSLGISMVSVANNHTDDFGRAGYEETLSALGGADISTAPHAVEINGIKIAFFAWDDIAGGMNISAAADEITKAKSDAAFVVVSAHFGEEYKTAPSVRQRTAARAFIDAGADVVIGHHPHVVQETEIYRGKPIFYSLGNFLFDQYFSEETQMGLGVRAVISDDSVSYRAFPIDLHASRPRPGSGETQDFFFRR